MTTAYAVLVEISQKVREAYLAHRINHSELVQLSQCKNEKEIEERFADLVRIDVDQRLSEPSTETLQAAWSHFGLAQEFEKLDRDKPWTAYERSLFRRLSHPENDPAWAPDPAVEEAAQSSQAKESRRQFCEVAGNIFDKWNSNGDLILSKPEIDRAMASGELPDQQAAALPVLRSKFDLLSTLDSSAGGISHLGLSSLAQLGFPGNPSVGLKLVAGYENNLERLQHESLLDLSEHTLKIESAKDNRQGSQGSCVLLSTLGGMPAEQIGPLLHVQNDGYVQVDFKDGDQQIVAPLTRSEQLFHTNDVYGTPWAGYLEVAMGQRRALAGESPDGTARSAGDGIPVQEAFKALTGQPAQQVALDDLSINQTREMLREVVSQPVLQRGPIIAGTRSDPIYRDRDAYDVEELNNNIVNSHCYSIQNFDSQTDTVSLWNPMHRYTWLEKGDETSGDFQMPLDQFYSSFRWVAFQSNGSPLNKS